MRTFYKQIILAGRLKGGGIVSDAYLTTVYQVFCSMPHLHKYTCTRHLRQRHVPREHQMHGD